MARGYLLKRDYRQAQARAEKIVAANPDEASAKQTLDAAKVGKLDDNLKRLIQPTGKPQPAKLGDDGPTTANAATGWQMFDQGRFRTAERIFRTALKEDADNLSALNGLAFCVFNQGEHEEAKTMFEKYLAIEPGAPGPMNGLARCLKVEGKVDEALQLWEVMYKAYPGPNAGAWGLAQTYLEERQYDKAVKYFRVIADVDPANEAAQRGLKAAQAGLGRNQ